MDHKEMSRKGGQAKSEAKTKAARINATQPRVRWATAIAYEFVNTKGETRFGVHMKRGKVKNDLPHKLMEIVIKGNPIEKGQVVYNINRLSSVTKKI